MTQGEIDMKAQNLLFLLFLCVLQSTSLFAQTNKGTFSLFPLEIGNKHLFLRHYIYTDRNTNASTHYYYIDSINITSSKIYNSKTYYNYGDVWLSYSSTDTTIYQLNIYSGSFSSWVYKALSPLGSHCTINFLGNSYPCYEYTSNYFGGPGNMTSIASYYSQNIGLGYYEEHVRASIGAADTYKTLIGMISTDSLSGFLKQDEAAPSVSEPTTALITDANKIKINSIIKHKFSYKTDPANNVSVGCSFIKTAKIEYFYKKNNDTLQHQISYLSMDSEIDFTGILEYRADLLANGYDIYYKIYATDKALNPHTTVYPVSDYNKLNLDLTQEYKLNYYPLSIGNYWFYDKYKVNTSTNKSTFNSRIKVSVIGDTVLSNGVKYYKIINNNELRYERIDSARGVIYNATDSNNVVIEKTICYLFTNSGDQSYVSREYKDDYFNTQDLSVSAFNVSNLPAKKYTSVSDTAFSFTMLKEIGLLNEKYKFYNYTTSQYEFYILKLSYAKVGDLDYGASALPNDVLNRNPLKIGNKLTYERKLRTGAYFPTDTINVWVEKDTLLSNGLKYFKIVSEEETAYKRIDSLEGKVYLAHITNNQIEDYLVDDLLAINGQIVNIFYKDGFYDFAFRLGSTTNSIINSGTECITAAKLYSSQVYFTRSFEYGIIEECFPLTTSSGVVNIKKSLISVSNDNISDINFYPLAINNSWIYDVYLKKDNQNILVSRKGATIVGDTLLKQNNKPYYVIDRGDKKTLERIDLISGFVYRAQIDANKNVIEDPIYSLYNKDGKAQLVNRNGILSNFNCSNDSINVFNNYLVASKSFTDVKNNSNSFTMCKGIGLYTEDYSSNDSIYFQELKYAKVGEKTFGSKISPANILNRLPLNIGDEFIYERSSKVYYSPSFNLYDTLIIKVEKDTLLSNNLKYFKLFTKEGSSFVRIDSALGNVYKAKFDNKNITEILTDNLYAFDNQTLKISFYDDLNVFRYASSNPNNDIELITAVLPSDSTIYFTRCYNVGIVKACRLKKVNDVYTYFYDNLIGAKIGDSFWGDYEEITTGNVKPTDFDLSQNYPNPFNPSTTINYSIPQEGLVKIKVFDILGREVTQLVNSQLHAGTYKAEFNSTGLASGVYIYSLFVDNNLKSSKKMILVK